MLYRVLPLKAEMITREVERLFKAEREKRERERGRERKGVDQ